MNRSQLADVLRQALSILESSGDIPPASPWDAIPPNDRTRPMTLQDACYFLGMEGTASEAKKLRRWIDAKQIHAIPLGFKWVFALSMFPADSHRDVHPSAGRRGRR